MQSFGLFVNTDTILHVGVFHDSLVLPVITSADLLLLKDFHFSFLQTTGMSLIFLADNLWQINKSRKKLWPIQPLTKAASAGTRRSEPGICSNRPSTGSQQFLPTHKGVFHNQITAQSESHTHLKEKQRRYFWDKAHWTFEKASWAILSSLNRSN